jgi:redox-sensitive bicupin YhaK (pirin superfamily)
LGVVKRIAPIHPLRHNLINSTYQFYPMLQAIKSSERHLSDHGWLKSYLLFSFSDYRDPKNMEWGALRVFNDDTIGPRNGFPPHPHSEMEVVTIVLDGEITHKDGMGNEASFSSGQVQSMTAGTGVVHSEFNLGITPLHIYQLWIRPSKPKLAPSYDRKQYSLIDMKNRLLPLASGQGMKGAAKINADATVYRSELDAGKWIEFKTSPSRKLFIYLTYGRIEVNGRTLTTNDQARIENETLIKIKGKRRTDFVLVDVPG